MPLKGMINEWYISYTNPYMNNEKLTATVSGLKKTKHLMI